MDKTIRRLPDAELEVMQAVWACEAPVARADIDAKLKDTHPMALTTLLTVLTRLADKGFLRIKKQGRSAHQLYCKEDRSLNRGLWYLRSQLNYYRKTARYYGNKGLTD